MLEGSSIGKNHGGKGGFILDQRDHLEAAYSEAVDERCSPAHLSMYMHTMELVRLGDTSVDAYDRPIALFKSNVADVETCEGLGLEDRLAENRQWFRWIKK
ncbi:hypothetical protein ACQJBY_020749 [Aegilops geniculata]